MAVGSIEIIKKGRCMTITRPQINLDEKTPEELRRLLDSVKVNPTMEFKDKQYWIGEINARLNGKTLDITKAMQIKKEIEEGMADLEDVGN